MNTPYHHHGRPTRQSNPLQAAMVILVLTAATVVMLLGLFGCQAAPAPTGGAPVPPPPVSVAPSVQANAAALDQAGAAVAAIPAQADAAAAAAPVVKPQAEAIKTAAATAAGAVATAKTNSAAVSAGVDERDRNILALRDLVNKQAAAMKKETERADAAEKALADRARNRIEWALIIGGFAAWGAAALAAYMAFQAGSVIRAAGLAVAGFLVGAACFAAAAYFDLILTIGAWTLGAAALVGLVVAVLHYRKHLGHAQDEILDHIEAHGATQARLDALQAAVATPSLN